MIKIQNNRLETGHPLMSFVPFDNTKVGDCFVV